MKPAEVKAYLFERRMNVSQMARDIHAEYDPTVDYDSLRVMLGDLLFGRRYFPRLAQLVKRRYRITIERPAHLQPTRQLKRAA